MVVLHRTTSCCMECFRYIGVNLISIRPQDFRIVCLLSFELMVTGVFLLMILIPLVATERTSAKFVFTNFNTDNGDGINNNLYIFVLGLLMSQYTLTGYDASAHMVSSAYFSSAILIAFLYFLKYVAWTTWCELIVELGTSNWKTALNFNAMRLI